MAYLRQSSPASVRSGHRRCSVTLTQTTLPGSLIYLVATTTHAGNTDPGLKAQAAFGNPVRYRTENELTLAVWRLENAPPMSTFEVTTDRGRSIQLRVMEWAGAAQSNVLDRVTVLGAARWSREPSTGITSTTLQKDEIVIAAIANRYASTTQYGFYGGLARLFDQVSPSGDPDDYRTRLTVHSKVATSIGQFFLRAYLATARDWIAILLTFRGGSSGPIRMVGDEDEPGVTIGGTGDLTVFGPLESEERGVTIGGTAIIGPFNYQYRLNDWDGLLIGSGTRYMVEGTEGLYGYTVRTSDDDRPRADGAQRGIDLQNPRRVLFKMNVGRGRGEVELRMLELYRALRPQRDEDWPLIWRHPEHNLRMMKVRPVSLPNERDSSQLMIASQTFELLAADPRHYSAISQVVEVPNSPDPVIPVYTRLYNIGNAAAYPLIRIKGPPSGEPVTRIELVNANGLYNLNIRLVLPPGGELVADMEAWTDPVTRSIISLDNQPKYGAWQEPRDPFLLEPHPVVEDGENVLYLRTEPLGAAVECTVEYRHTWSG